MALEHKGPLDFVHHRHVVNNNNYDNLYGAVTRPNRHKGASQTTNKGCYATGCIMLDYSRPDYSRQNKARLVLVQSVLLSWDHLHRIRPSHLITDIFGPYKYPVYPALYGP